MAKPILYRPPSKNLVWGALGCTLVIYVGAVIAAIKREPPPMNLADIPTATVEATLDQPEDQPTPPPRGHPNSGTAADANGRSLNFTKKPTPPPPKTQKPTKPAAPIKAPQVGISKPAAMSISGAKAFVTNGPKHSLSL